MEPDKPTCIPLLALARTRSGDKGNRANIGVRTLDQAAYDWLEQHLTEARVAAFLEPLGVGKVVRYAIPGLQAFNFVIENALAGGASRSLHLDTQGKTLGTILLELPIPSPDSTRQAEAER